MTLTPEEIAKDFDILIEDSTRTAKIFGGHIETGPPSPTIRSIINYCKINFEYEFLDPWNYRITLKYNNIRVERERNIPYENNNTINWQEFFEESIDIARCEFSKPEKN